MRNKLTINKILKVIFLVVCSALPFLSCKAPAPPYKGLGKPMIVAGTAKLTGTIKAPNAIVKDGAIVTVAVSHQISGEFVKYKAVVDQSGNFSLNADVEANLSFGNFSTSLNPGRYILLKLNSEEATHIDITYNSSAEIESITGIPGMSQHDILRATDLIGRMIEFPQVKEEPLYNSKPEDFLNSAKANLIERLAVVESDSLLSDELKGVLTDDFRLLFYNGALFDYDKAMHANYSITNGDKNKKPVIQKVDRSYYRFLKDLKLNDPKYLYAYGSFWEFQRRLLQNEVLAIPPIAEVDIPTWLAGTKEILADLLGFNDGLYYDILAASAYGRQLTEELRPFSEKQKGNITSYWGNGAIAKILFRKNEQVAKLDKLKSPVVINDVASIAVDKIIETILSKHKGKVVLVDFWATWCGPCLDAMQRFRNTKAEYYGKDVVFVYLTNRSSPRKLWEEKVKGIGNEHYYLDDNQWTYLMKQFGFEYIPSYLLYNKNGVLNNKFTAFPENEAVKKMIDGLL
ncbi:MAG: TlpA disulfide reductase family protein [Bacteroidota bacterium]